MFVFVFITDKEISYLGLLVAGLTQYLNITLLTQVSE